MNALSQLTHSLITLALAPGIFAHEAAHYLACRLLGVRVTAVHADPFDESVGIDHERIESFPTDLVVGLAPLAGNTALALGSLALLPRLPDTTEPLTPALWWVAVTAAFTAIPSHVDTETFTETARNAGGVSRTVGLAVALPLRAATALPWLAGVYGMGWVYVCLAVGLG